MPGKNSLFGFARMRGALRHIDGILTLSMVPLLAAGLVTINSFVSENSLFERQVVWIMFGTAAFLGASFVDWRFLKNTKVVVALFLGIIASLLLLFVAGTVTKGALSRFDVGAFFIQPSDPAKLVLIIVLAKYFSRRHIEIAHIRHIIISGVYTLLLFGLVFLQPDFGGAIIIFLVWLGMVLVSGISKKHLLAVFLIGLLSFGGLWFFVFADYQKARIRTFINPLTDIHGAGYNAYQSTVTVGSGELIGKGLGFGTQSRLRFLPEYETDFVFAAFAEEWGFVGIILVFVLFGILMWRIIRAGMRGASNFETLYAYGLATLFLAHFTIHVGMNIGILPVTGTTIPFMSYGGSHLLMEFVGLGILMGMRRYGRPAPRQALTREFVGPK